MYSVDYPAFHYLGYDAVQYIPLSLYPRQPPFNWKPLMGLVLSSSIGRPSDGASQPVLFQTISMFRTRPLLLERNDKSILQSFYNVAVVPKLLLKSSNGLYILCGKCLFYYASSIYILFILLSNTCFVIKFFF